VLRLFWDRRRSRSRFSGRRCVFGIRSCSVGAYPACLPREGGGGHIPSPESCCNVPPDYPLLPPPARALAAADDRVVVRISIVAGRRRSVRYFGICLKIRDCSSLVLGDSRAEVAEDPASPGKARGRRGTTARRRRRLGGTLTSGGRSSTVVSEGKGREEKRRENVEELSEDIRDARSCRDSLF